MLSIGRRQQQQKKKPERAQFLPVLFNSVVQCPRHLFGPIHRRRYLYILYIYTLYMAGQLFHIVWLNLSLLFIIISSLVFSWFGSIKIKVLFYSFFFLFFSLFFSLGISTVLRIWVLTTLRRKKNERKRKRKVENKLVEKCDKQIMNLRERDRERESIYNNDIEREGESERERARQPWHRAR